MKKILGTTALLLGVVGAAIALSAGPASAAGSIGQVYWGNNGVGECQLLNTAAGTQLTFTTPQMTVYGLWSTATPVRAYIRLTRTDGSWASNWLSMGSGTASSTRGLTYGASQIVKQVSYPQAYLQVQIQVQWFNSVGTLVGYQTYTVNSYDYYAYGAGYLGRVSSCQG
jgi:hypothetical protein